jgi:alkylation response protein AidB-like acyl-CoA dehydrogenase
MVRVQPFNQPPPELGNQYDDDRVLRAYLRRTLPEATLAAVEPELRDMGALAGGPLYRKMLEDRPNEPRLVQWSAWGERLDRIEVTALWQEAERLAAERGLVATAYEKKHGPWSRVVQFALVHLFGPSTDVYSCPLAMTDGAAKTLLTAGNQALIDRALPRLTSRDPRTFWTSGQWMTESTGGSDVGRSETVAVRDGDTWRLYGRKWFTSAIASQMAVTLARPEGNGPGGSGLALFYLETHDAEGRPNRLLVHRLKDKLGTRKVPTAELTLDGTPATLVLPGVTTHGTRHIAPMLNVTRTWNAVSAAAGFRRGLALARDFARKRVAFGAPLSEKPLHLDTLAGVAAEAEGCFLLAFRVVELLGREETGVADAQDLALLRILTPIAKLLTGKQAVAGASELVESFGGAGYVEDTGLPMLLRDAQVLSIWEGTTNVLSLDTLRALGKEGGLEAVAAEVRRASGKAKDPALAACAHVAEQAVEHATRWVQETFGSGQAARLEAGARRFAMTLGRAVELALLVEHAQWSLDVERDGRARAAAVRFLRHGVDLVRDDDERAEAAALANDAPLPIG